MPRKKDPRNNIIAVKLTDDEEKLFDAAAQRAHMNLSEFMRQAARYVAEASSGVGGDRPWWSVAK